MSLYFNNAFAKQPLEESVAAMQPFLRAEFENPLTESEGGDKARNAMDQARASVADLIGANAAEIFFVSSGTEANNWALKGAALANRKKNHIVLSSVEHFSIYQTAQFLQKQGLEITVIPAGKDGLVDPADVAAAIRYTTALVTIQASSDEIGVAQDVSAIASLKSRFPEVLFHTDAIQYLCYESLDVRAHPFDLVSISSNALYGPPGVAALFVRDGTRLIPLLHGGMQEEGRRPGLQSIALIAGFGKAAEMNRIRKAAWKEQLCQLQLGLLEALDHLGVPVTGSRSRRSVDNVHAIADVDGEAVLTLLQEEGIQATSGSTCYQYAQKESHVLQALGYGREETRGALLWTLGIDHTVREVDFLANALGGILKHLRTMKP